MQTTTQDFHTMRGHVADGCEIKAPSGRIYTLRSAMNGWIIYNQDNQPITGYLPSASDVEYFVVNGLSSG